MKPTATIQKAILIFSLIVCVALGNISCSDSDSDSDDSPDPNQTVFEFGEGWEQVSTHGLGIIAIKNEGTLWTWQRNQGTRIPFIVGNDTDWRAVSLSSHVLALKNNGTLWVSGYFPGYEEYSLVPKQYGTDRSWVDIDANGIIAAIDVNGFLRVWGYLNDLPSQDWC